MSAAAHWLKRNDFTSDNARSDSILDIGLDLLGERADVSESFCVFVYIQGGKGKVSYLLICGDGLPSIVHAH